MLGAVCQAPCDLVKRRRHPACRGVVEAGSTPEDALSGPCPLPGVPDRAADGASDPGRGRLVSGEVGADLAGAGLAVDLLRTRADREGGSERGEVNDLPALGRD